MLQIPQHTFSHTNIHTQANRTSNIEGKTTCQSHSRRRSAQKTGSTPCHLTARPGLCKRRRGGGSGRAFENEWARSQPAAEQCGSSRNTYGHPQSCDDGYSLPDEKVLHVPLTTKKCCKIKLYNTDDFEHAGFSKVSILAC